MTVSEEKSRAGASSAEPHLAYLDGLRGVAALYVVMHHAFVDVSPSLPMAWGPWVAWAWNGQIAVQMFIVLSGYCLMLPVAKSGQLRGGWWPFIQRRAWRILPPYYAALALSLLVIAFVPGLNTPERQGVDPTLPAFTVTAIASHLLLVQDLSAHWITKISAPMWTIAQEWHIYFAFAFLLLPVWRRAGMAATVLLAFLIAEGLRNFPGHDFTYAAPQFLMLFAFGMWAATIHFNPTRDSRPATNDRRPWGLLAMAAWGVYVALMLQEPDQPRFQSMLMAVIEAFAMLWTLLFCTAAIRRGQGHSHPLLRVLGSRPAVLLGTFSYSLYLAHAPVLLVLNSFAPKALRFGAGGLAAQLLLVVPIVVAFAFAFHCVAERPFLNRSSRSAKRPLEPVSV